MSTNAKKTKKHPTMLGLSRYCSISGLCIVYLSHNFKLPAPPLSNRMTILPPTEKLKIVLQKISAFHKRFTEEFS